MRRRTIRRAAELVARAIPDNDAVIDSTFADARHVVEMCAEQLATQQLLTAEAEARKPGGFRARTFARTVEHWQGKHDDAVAAYNRLAAEHGRPAWGEAPPA